MSAIAKPLKRKLQIALIQLSAGFNKTENLQHFKTHIDKAINEFAPKKLDLVVLPECFNSPYSVNEFKNYAETIPTGETTKFLSDIAKENKIFLVGGSFPELGEDGNIYNTSLTFDPQGEIIGKHRKAHLFDIDIKGGITFQESLTLTGGEKASVYNLEGVGKIGLGICYDIRFPELAQIAARSPYDAFAMVYPGAFNTTTGPLHWHLLARARAVDNQIFVVVCSPARDLSSGYHAYGHSLVVDPYGKIIAEAGEEEEIIYAELDPELVEKVRTGIPINQQRRFDIYKNVAEGAKVSDK